MAQQAQQAAAQALKGFGGKGVLGGAGALVGLAAAAYGVNASLYNVDGGHRAVKYSRIFGVQDQVYAEGTHFRVPWLEQAIIYDVRAKPRNIPSLTGTKDLQMVNITVRVLTRPHVDKLPMIYKTLGMDYDEIVLPSIVNETLKSVVAQFNAAQLITQRERVSKLVRDHLSERAQRFNILVDDISITHLKFGTEFAQAVEAKQIAQQDAQRAAFLVEKASMEKQSAIVRAEGEAKAAELIGKAIMKNPGFLELRKIENAREIAGTLANSKNRLYLSADTLLLNVQEGITKPTGGEQAPAVVDAAPA